MTFYWYLAIYFISVGLACKLIQRERKIDPGQLEEKYGHIINVDKVLWYVCWIPFYNLYVSYKATKHLISWYFTRRMIKKLVFTLHVAHPDDEATTIAYHTFFKTKFKLPADNKMEFAGQKLNWFLEYDYKESMLAYGIPQEYGFDKRQAIYFGKFNSKKRTIEKIQKLKI